MAEPSPNAARDAAAGVIADMVGERVRPAPAVSQDPAEVIAYEVSDVLAPTVSNRGPRQVTVVEGSLDHAGFAFDQAVHATASGELSGPRPRKPRGVSLQDLLIAKMRERLAGTTEAAPQAKPQKAAAGTSAPDLDSWAAGLTSTQLDRVSEAIYRRQSAEWETTEPDEPIEEPTYTQDDLDTLIESARQEALQEGFNSGLQAAGAYAAPEEQP